MDSSIMSIIINIDRSIIIDIIPAVFKHILCLNVFSQISQHIGKTQTCPKCYKHNI
jgi:hypothetical protein